MKDFIVDDENESSAESCYRDETSPSPSEVSVDNLQADQILPESESEDERPLAKRLRTRSTGAFAYTRFFPPQTSAMPEVATEHLADESEGFEVLVHESKEHLQASVADEDEGGIEVKPESFSHSPPMVSPAYHQSQQTHLTEASSERQQLFQNVKAAGNLPQGATHSDNKSTQQGLDSPPPQLHPELDTQC